MASMAVDGAGERGSSAARNLPPLLTIVGAVVLALVILPSALKLPQSNPQTTLEYAPVPPDNNKNQTPPNGNLSELGLAGSNSGLSGGGALGGNGPGGGPGLPGLPGQGGGPGGVGKNPETKHCVGNPPRQTEDPLAPPCVANFAGDNFGSTYQGVTKGEVTVLFYIQGNIDYVDLCKDTNQATPDRQYFDLAQPAPSNGNEFCVVRDLRTYQRYFNDRYQTYGRFVHFWVYFSANGDSDEERRADAADNYAKLHPFAVISTAGTYNDSYLDYMASRGVLNFGAFLARPEAFFQAYPKLVWGFPPSLEEKAKSFVNYICREVAGRPTDISGSPANNGQTRVYGLWHNGDPGHPELSQLSDEVVAGLKSQCNVTFAAEATFPEAGYAKSAHATPLAAEQAVALFQSKGVNTVIWPGGLETNFTNSEGNYRPELFLIGDGLLDSNFNSSFQNGDAFNKAHIITDQTFQANIRQDPCYTSFYEADPNASDAEARGVACPLYPLIRQLFVGIQVAGPRLGPTSIDAGFHAIPPQPSTSPAEPSCFYNPGDYTCVKDAEAEWWDETGRASSAQQGNGCWRSIEGGKRYFGDQWPARNAGDADTPSDPCNTYDNSILVNPNPPNPSNP